MIEKFFFLLQINIFEHLFEDNVKMDLKLIESKIEKLSRDYFRETFLKNDSYRILLMHFSTVIINLLIL